jgi:hypothetical protein
MNQIEAIRQLTQVDAFEIGYHRVWICSDCMNAIIDDEEQAAQIDLGLIKINDDIARCDIIDLIEGHEYAA